MRLLCLLTSLFLNVALSQTISTFRVETLAGADIPGSVPGLNWDLSQKIWTMAAGPDGSVWFQERGWRKLTPDGRLQTVPIQGAFGPECDISCCRPAAYFRIVISPEGLPHIFDPVCEVVRRIQPDGKNEIVVGKVSRLGLPNGNGGSAKDAQLGVILSMAFDPQGNLYLLGTGVIRKIDTRGVITEFVKLPFRGSGLAVNRQGAVFVAETAIPHRIMKFEPDGKSSLYATGNGDPNWSLDEVVFDGAGNLYGRGKPGQPILRLTPEGKLQAVPNTVNYADGFAVDRAGNVYFNDSRFSLSVADSQGRIRRVAGSGQTAMDAGKGVKYADLGSLRAVSVPNQQGLWLGFNEPSYPGPGLKGLYLLDPSSRIQRIVEDSIDGVAVDSTGSPYYKRYSDVFKLDSARNGAPVLVVPQFGTSYTAAFALDSMDRFYTTHALYTYRGPYIGSEISQQHVDRLDPRTGERTILAGNGTAGDSGDGGLATAAQLRQPVGVAVDRDGSVFIADLDAHRVRKVDPAGRISTVAGTGVRGIGAEGVTANTTPLSGPWSVAVDTFGNLYVAESSRLINPTFAVGDF